MNDETCYNCGRARPGMFGFAPLVRQFGQDFGLTPFIFGVCSIMFLLSVLLMLAIGAPLTATIMSIDGNVLSVLGASGRFPVFGLGRWWTVLSASWLHGGLLHLVMNMMSVRNLVPGSASIFGPSRTVIIYVVAGACGFVLSSYMGHSLTIGASASICGLIGALVHYGRSSGSSLIYNQAIQWAFGIVLFGFVFQGIDNWAHAGGFAGGYVASMALKPTERERGDHALIAGVCVLASLASLVYAVFVNWEPISGALFR
ncbi:MAG: rhomboid family intramembrane serine protease [Vicinamibacterales bacterium]